MKEYIAVTKHGGKFSVEAKDVKGAWKAAKKEEAEINKVRKSIGMVNFNYQLCKVVKIKKMES